MVRELLNPTVYHSGSDHCLRRHGLGPHRDRKAKDDTLKHSGLKAFEPGYIHIDVKYPPHIANGHVKSVSKQFKPIMARRSLTAFSGCAGATQHDSTRLIRFA